MNNDELLEFLTLTLFTKAKATGRSNTGKTPNQITGVVPDDVNEIDIVYESRLRIKAFYTSAQTSNNPTAFYLEINEPDLEIWQQAALAFHKRNKTTIDHTRLEELRALVKPKTSTVVSKPIETKGNTGW